MPVMHDQPVDRIAVQQLRRDQCLYQNIWIPVEKHLHRKVCISHAANRSVWRLLSRDVPHSFSHPQGVARGYPESLCQPADLAMRQCATESHLSHISICHEAFHRLSKPDTARDEVLHLAALPGHQ